MGWYSCINLCALYMLVSCVEVGQELCAYSGTSYLNDLISGICVIFKLNLFVLIYLYCFL